jgi:hypothetical protein
MDLVENIDLKDRSINEFMEKYKLFAIPIEFTIEKNAEKSDQLISEMQSLKI